MTQQDYYTPEEVAEKFSVTLETVDQWCTSGHMAYVDIQGQRRILVTSVKKGISNSRNSEILQARMAARGFFND